METTKAAKIATTDQWKSGDRLSSLPNEIISHILSFLPTKYAVGTAALSRRWKDLWTRVRNLDFDNRLVHNNPLEYIRVEAKRRDAEFSRFVDRVLSQHENLNSVRRFHFHFCVQYYDCELSRDFWCTKMESQLEEIDITLKSLYRDGPIRKLWSPPVTLYTLKNLKVLKLHGVIIRIVPSSVLLSSVNSLQLLRVRMNDCESLSRLISGCPVLETLHLENCFFKDIWKEEHIFTASIPSLKNLTIINYSGPLNCSIEIEAPSLEHLGLENFTRLQFMGSSSSPLSCLHSASVDVPVSYFLCIDEEGQYDRDGFDQIELLTQISNAKEMLVSWQTLSLLTVVNGRIVPQRPLLPLFRNLTHLTMKPSRSSLLESAPKLARSSSVLHSMLDSASKLQHLVIDMVNGRIRMDWEDSEELACTPECMLSSLEEIKIENLKAGEGEMKMVAYLLKAGAVLKKVNMHLRDDVDHDFDNIEDHRLKIASLLKLPRGSSTCEVHLFLPNGNEIHIDSYMV